MMGGKGGAMALLVLTRSCILHVCLIFIAASQVQPFLVSSVEEVFIAHVFTIN